VYDIKRKLVESEKMITASVIKEIILGNDQRNRMLIKIFKDYNEDVKNLIGVDYSESTYTKYERTQRLVQEFIKKKHGTDDIHIKRLDFEFVTQLELWFKTERRCSHNTTMKYISILNMIVLFCVDNRWLEYDPFARFEMKQEEKDPTFLMKDEVEAIANKKISIERIRRVRDVYIFCCYTGLAFADVQKLNKSEISVGVDGEIWIFSDRFKTDVKSRIPLLDIPLKILKRYENDPECINSNKVLPVLSNQKYNSYLKEIADICGITKKLTTHTARHTFGTTVTLTNGVPLESVKKMMGHKKLSTTQKYARVLDIKISEDMQKIKSRLKSVG
jgi:site-specific recombinase XerD